MLLNILQGIGQPPTTKNDLVQTVSSAEVGKPWSICENSSIVSIYRIAVSNSLIVSIPVE